MGEPVHIRSRIVRRLRAIALEAFKILNNLSPVYLNDLLTFKNLSYSFRYTQTVEIPQVRTSRNGTRSFRSTAAKMWNNLPQHFRDITSYNVFKNQVNSWSGEACVCVRFVQTFKFCLFMLVLCFMLYACFMLHFYL